MTALRSLTGLMFAVLLLAACGRAGPLEPPPASVAQGDGQTQTEPRGEDRPFILDPLIE